MCGVSGPSLIEIATGLTYSATIIGAFNFSIRKEPKYSIEKTIIRTYAYLLSGFILSIPVFPELIRSNTLLLNLHIPAIALIAIFYTLYHKKNCIKTNKLPTFFIHPILALLTLSLCVIITFFGIGFMGRSISEPSNALLFFLVPSLSLNLLILYLLKTLFQIRVSKTVKYTFSVKELILLATFTSIIFSIHIFESHKHWFDCYGKINISNDVHHI